MAAGARGPRLRRLRRPARSLLIIAAVLLLLVVGGRAAVELYTDALWYGSVGYLSVFWTRLGAAAVVRVVSSALAATVVLLNLWIVFRHLGPIHVRRRYGNLEIAEQIPRRYLIGAMALVAVLAGWWLSSLQFGGGASLATLAWIRQVGWGVTDPVFGRDLSFFLFSLPIYFRIVDLLVLTVLWSLVLVLLGYVLVGGIRLREGRLEVEHDPRVHFSVLIAAVVFLLGARYWFGRYDLLVQGTGFGGALGYTDVTARLPGQAVLAALAVGAGVTLLYGAWRRTWLPPLVGLGVLLFAAIVVGRVVPSLVQKFQVEPNQREKEAPYLRWNLEFTRRAYQLAALERRPFPYRRQPLPGWAALSPSLAQLPLWDPEPLRTTYNQLQAIFGYYRFPHVDYDRYGPPGQQEQVAIAVREFHPEGLSQDVRTWQTLRLNPKYVRGLGVVVTPAGQMTVQGEPVLWVADLPPERAAAAPAELNLRDPSIYFGETMGEYVVLVPGRDSALLGTPGRDFPEGIRLASLPRVLAFAWRFGDKNLLFSGELTEESRVVFRRALDERLRALAPFLLWDPDPYPVVERGRVLWIVDGYTASASFPLAKPVEVAALGARLRYLRNSVKATVDAVTGDVRLYALDSPDPLLETYRRIFPDLIQPLHSLPVELRAHLRYPLLNLAVQADVLEEYHLEDVGAFFAGQDYWALPKQRDEAGAERPYRPAFALLRLPGEERSEFLLVMPFIAMQRQNMTALLIARNDPGAYGQLLLLELPRDQQIPGPEQVRALIEQDPAISPQLSLWRQAGSDVDIGQLRVVPLDSTFVYVEPLFLSAQGSPIPELRRVVVSDGRLVAMAATLAEAVDALSGPGAAAPVVRQPGVAALPPTGEWPQRALQLLQRAEEQLRRGDFAGFGESWAALRELLREAARPRRP